MRVKTREVLEYWFCLAGLPVIAAGVLYPALLGKVPADVDGIYFLLPWQEARPPEMDVSHGATGDALRYLPWRVFLCDAAARGDSLLWNPLEGCGMPYLAMWQTRCFSPFSVPFYFLSLRHALQASAWLKLTVAGLCAFFMARRFGLPVSMALVVGLVFQLSGVMLASLSGPLGDVLAWFPLLILCADRLSLALHHAWLGTALVLGLMLLGGEPGATASAVLLAGLFMALRMAMGRIAFNQAATNLVVYVGATLAAGSLAAAQVLPFLEFLREAADAGYRSGESLFRFTDLVAAVFPRFWGPASAMGSGSPAIFLYYGLVPVLLLPLWLSLRSYPTAIRRSRVEALLLTSALATVLALTLGPLFRDIPVAKHLGPAYLLLGNAIALAVMAAETADEWIELDATDCGTTLKRLLFFAPLFGAFLAALVFGAHGVSGAATTSLVWQALLAAPIALAFVVLFLVTLFRPSARLMGYGLCGLVAVDLLLTFQPVISFATPEQLFPETPVIESLKNAGTRIAGTDTLRRWPLSGNLVAQAYSSSGIQLRRHAAFLERAQEQPLLLRRTGAQTLLLTGEDINGPLAAMRPLLTVKQVFSPGAILVEDPGGKPRAWMAYATREVGAFDPAQLDPNLPPLVERVVPPPSAPASEASVAVVEESNACVRLRVENGQPGVLVLADSWYPGWKARVDGAGKAVFPVDGFLRGVMLDPGTHEVEFYFAGYSFWLGVVFTALTSVVLVFAVGRLVFHAVRRRDRWQTW